VPEGVKLLEVDPRGRKASWTGIDSRGKTIANAVTKAISIHTEAVTVQSRRALSLVK
jgi:xanthine dehydrogenase accessory factor